MAEETEHPVHIPLKAKAEGHESVEKLERHIEKLSESVDKTVGRLAEMGMAIAGIGGAFGFERMVETGRESLEQVSKLAKLTGTTADNVAAFRDTFEQAGLGADQFARSMTMLSKKALSLEEGGKAIGREAKAWGVELDKGPVKALISMSEAVEKHKIGQAQVMKLTGVTKENLGGMMELLGKGPDELRATIDEAKRLNKHLADPAALEAFQKFHEASAKIHQAWRRISERLVVALAPALERMADRLSSFLNNVHVEKWIDPLVNGLEAAVKHAKTLGAIMLANSILEKTGKGGIASIAMKGIGFGGTMGRKAFGMAESGLAGLIGRIPGAGSAVVSVGSALGPIGGAVGWLLKLAASAAGIGIAAAAVYGIIKNFDTIKERLGGVFEKLWGSIKRLGGAFYEMISPLLSKLWNFWSRVIEVWMNALSKVMDVLSDIINVATTFLTGKNADERKIASDNKKYAETIGQFVGNGPMAKQLAEMRNAKPNAPVTDTQRALFEKYAKAREQYGAESTPGFEALKKRYSKAPGAGDAPGAGVYQDFRNSRFDIQQKFAEGFDPDRVAVSFSNDLASLGERKLASGLTPLFSIR